MGTSFRGGAGPERSCPVHFNKHLLRARSELKLACVFNPPLSGKEIHDAYGLYPLDADEIHD
ncbi:MAG: ectoine synthase [Candidatus Competibacteraceae bacterium]|nr:ectoine synthase [Candidatus Competibacteraceae bacterium]